MNPLLLALVVASQNPTVTFEGKAERLSRLFPLLSQAVGLKLEANGSIGDEVLLLRLQAAPRQAVLDEIAFVTDGKWTPMEGGFRLTRDAELVRKRSIAELEEEAQNLLKSAQAFRASSLAKPFDQEEATNLSRELSKPNSQESGPVDYKQYLASRKPLSRTPAARLIAKLLPLIDWTAVARASEGVPLTFAAPANPLQIPLSGPQVAAAVREFEQEQKLWSDSGNVIPERNYEARQSITAVTSVQKVILNVRTYNQGQVHAEVYVRDGKGELINLGIQSLDSGAAILEMESTMNKAMADTAPLVLSPLVKAIGDFAQARNQNPGTPMPKEVADVLYQPLAIEPLSLGATEFFLAGAKDEKNLVANVPDALYLFSFQQGGGPAMTRGMAAGVVQRAFTRTERNGIAAYREGRMFSTFSGRVDRRIWQRMADEIKDGGGLSLDSRAAAALRSETKQEFSLYSMVLGTFTASMSGFEGGYEALRLYGLISPAQKSHLKSGGGIPFGRMSADMQTAFRDLLLSGGFDNFEITSPSPNSSYLSGSLLTEYLPKGVTPVMELHVQFDEEDPLFYPPQKTEEGYTMGMRRASIDEVAQSIYAKENPGSMPWMERRLGDLKFYMGKGLKVTMSVELDTGIKVSTELIDDRPATGRLLTVDQLPEGIRKRIDQALARTREMYKNVRIESGGGTKVPPPKP